MENSSARHPDKLMQARKSICQLITRVFISVGLVSCVAKSAITPQLATIEPTTSQTSTPGVSDLNERCKNLASLGLPVDSSLRKSHILYYAVNNIQDYPGDQIWITSMADGSDRLLVDKLSASRGIGFLPDGVHFIFVGSWISDIYGSPLKKINPSDYADSFPLYSPMWNLLTNDPDSLHNQYDAMSGYFSSYSPDQNHIAIWNPSIEKRDINDALPLVILNRKNGNKFVVLSAKLNERLAGSWSPDGKSFLFTLDPIVYIRLYRK
jgi:hypothetical protein